MNENEIMETSVEFPPEPGPTPEEQAEFEREAEKEREAVLAPYRKAAKTRKETAQTAAEHDTLMSDVLFELTLLELGEEV